MRRGFLVIFTLTFYSLLFSQESYFKEVGQELGVDYIYPGGHSQEVGAGVCILDVNNDGWDDFFQSGGVFESKLWINKNGYFIDATEKYNLDILDKYYVQSVVAGDINNDGYEDLFVSNYGVGGNQGDSLSPMLLLNVKGKRFKQVMEETFSFRGNFPAASFGDVNGDGFLDLYLADYVDVMDELRDENRNYYGYDPTCNPNKFFLNQQGKQFKEIDSIRGFQNDGCGLAVCFTDFDLDNDVDLILLNDFGSWNDKGNRIFRNNFPEFSFTDLSDSLAFYREVYGMGVGPGDFDRDGDLDYYITNIGQNFLFENQQHIFVERGLDLGVDLCCDKDSVATTSWSALFFDYENDADLDLYVANGNVFVTSPQTAIADPNQFLLNEGGEQYRNVSAQSGVDDILSHRGAALLDFDHDGDLDIISSLVMINFGQFGSLDQRIKLYRNENKHNNNWIGLKLIGGEGVNSSCIACSATLIQDDYKMIKEVDGGSGHGSQSSRILYFGLGEEEEAKEFLIKWIGKDYQSLYNLKSGKVYSVQRNGKLKVLY